MCRSVQMQTNALSLSTRHPHSQHPADGRTQWLTCACTLARVSCSLRRQPGTSPALSAVSLMSASATPYGILPFFSSHAMQSLYP